MAAIDIWSHAFELEDPADSRNLRTLSLLAALGEEIRAVRAFAAAQGWDEKMWRRQLVFAEESLQVTNLGNSWQSHRDRFATDIGGVFTALAWLGEVMPDEGDDAADSTDADSLRADLIAFRKSVAGADISRDLKTLLLDLVNEMVAAIDDAKIKGVRAVRERYVEVRARLAINHDVVEANRDVAEVTVFRKLEQRFVKWAPVITATAQIINAMTSLLTAGVHATHLLTSGHSVVAPQADFQADVLSSTEARA